MPLALTCASCGAANEPDERFCGDCGAPLDAPAAAIAEPQVERRLVSVLFADLVGHTAHSEGKDVEEVRSLLDRYFEVTRGIVERYGGEIEKFIGDAVMAVWGTPTAREDDAERAVRAALDLTSAVADLAETESALTVRAGVLTGEAAVTIGARGQGMVAGDLVNTASRVQALASPGSVLVGESTHRATASSIAYVDAGEHAVKGKTEPLRLWQALRVIAGRGGKLRSGVLEPPFVGRERELRLLKELFHASADERRAHLVSVVGIAGIGKSRLARELERYLDGVAETVFWHQGRCLAYGDGVAFSALAEMMRSRAGIVEVDDPAEARRELRAAIERHVEDPGERDWIEPRLAQLLAVHEGDTQEVSDVFAAWRLFLERLAAEHPVVLVFEDMQWADAPLLDFLEYLLDWSRGHRLFVLALARPELADRHPGWGSGLRNSATLSLEPLSPAAIDELLAGYVPGLPDEARERVVERAEGVPLYAVELVRMLVDRGLVEQRDGDFRTTGPIDDLQVPETLHALVAARLDGLSEVERRLVCDASLVGKSFPREALAAVSELPDEQLDAVLSALVRKEILSLDADPRSPDRGRYAFVQDLLRQVAYETMAKSERKRRHLRAAAHLEQGVEGAHELAEVVASHYLAALELDPDADDAAEIGASAHGTLVKAGERAAGLAATESAQRYYERALELTGGPLERAELHERAGLMAARRGSAADARGHFEQAEAAFAELGLPYRAARVSARLAIDVTWAEDHDIERAVADLERAFVVLVEGERDPDLAMFAVQSARPLHFSGRSEQAMARNELALDMGEALLLPEVIAEGLNTKALMLDARGRHQEAELLLRHSLGLALERDLSDAALRAYGNLTAILSLGDRYREALEVCEAGVTLARKVGDARREEWLQSWRTGLLALLGEWDAAVALGEAAREESIIWINVERGNEAVVGPLMAELAAEVDPNEPQQRVGLHTLQALVALRAGDDRSALERAEAAWADRAEVGLQAVAFALLVALEAAFALGDRAAIDELLERLETLPPGESTPWFRALAARFQGRRAALDGDEGVADAGFASAARILREIETPFNLAVACLDHAEWLCASGRPDEARPLFAEAREIFERLQAAPWLERVDRLVAEAGELAAVD